MSRDPLGNAVFAALYIAGVVNLLYFGIPLIAQPDQEPPLLFFIAILSLFVLSVLTMCLCFLLQPFVLAFEGKPKEGAAMLLKEAAIFAGIVLGLFATVFFIFA